MTIPKRAIELAIEGGWKHPFTGLPAHAAPTDEWLKANWKKYAWIALDRTFWQCLGKSLGWTDCTPCLDGTPEDHRYSRLEDDPGRYSDICNRCGGPFTVPSWEEQAHAFYDLILTGGDTAAFWDELLDK